MHWHSPPPVPKVLVPPPKLVPKVPPCPKVVPVELVAPAPNVDVPKAGAVEVEDPNVDPNAGGAEVAVFVPKPPKGVVEVDGAPKPNEVVLVFVAGAPNDPPNDGAAVLVAPKVVFPAVLRFDNDKTLIFKSLKTPTSNLLPGATKTERFGSSKRRGT